MDQAGKEVAPCIYDIIWSFREGLD
ncbi:WG repeat-containing protein [uncultured Campylobacter sp.]